jgi:para-aminobenzoate synthetase component 1
VSRLDYGEFAHAPRRRTPMLIEPQIEELTPPPEPWAMARRLAHLPHLLFLDSSGGSPDLARYSYLTADPFRWLQFRGSEAGDPFDALRTELAHWRTATFRGLPPFQGGAAGLFGYDLCHWIERLPRPRFDEFQTPDLAVGLYDWVIAWDHLEHRAWLISTGFPETEESPRQERARMRTRWIMNCTGQSPVPAAATRITKAVASANPLPGFDGVFSNFDRVAFLAAVQRAIDYAHAGDCFQINLAQRLLTRQAEPALELYGRLRRVNPAPFAAWFDVGDFQIASASPERFLQLSGGGQIQTRPIKGTRSRGRTPDEDRAKVAELMASSKDRAENVMIVDLLRNDLGRVCEYGSENVPAVCRLESHPTVHHLVSEVCGQLRSGLSAIDLLTAAFPGGSVTGAP